VLKAFDALFNKRDYKTAERYWSSNYIQHSAHIPEQMDLPQSGSVCRRSMK
jgi:predicted SnoaL-like aldol condensation-catalyzing enzyme